MRQVDNNPPSWLFAPQALITLKRIDWLDWHTQKYGYISIICTLANRDVEVLNRSLQKRWWWYGGAPYLFSVHCWPWRRWVSEDCNGWVSMDECGMRRPQIIEMLCSLKKLYNYSFWNNKLSWYKSKRQVCIIQKWEYFRYDIFNAKGCHASRTMTSSL